MELTVLAASSLFLVGFGYVFVRRAKQFRVVGWTLLGVSLFALATRDLFRSREQSRAAAPPRNSPDSAANRTDRIDSATDRTDRTGRTGHTDDDRRRIPFLKRLRRRLSSWLG